MNQERERNADPLSSADQEPGSRRPVEYLRAKDVAALLHCSRAHVYNLINQGILPKPIKLGERMALWKRSDIDEAIERLR